jgi:hypothetical protein
MQASRDQSLLDFEKLFIQSKNPSIAFLGG